MLGTLYSNSRPCRQTGNFLSISSPRNSQPNGWRSSQELIAIPFVIVLSLSKTSTVFGPQKTVRRKRRDSMASPGTSEYGEIRFNRRNWDWPLLNRGDKDSCREL